MKLKKKKKCNDTKGSGWEHQNKQECWAPHIILLFFVWLILGKKKNKQKNKM